MRVGFVSALAFGLMAAFGGRACMADSVAFRPKFIERGVGAFEITGKPEMRVFPSVSENRTASLTRLGLIFSPVIKPVVISGSTNPTLPSSPHVLAGLIKDHPALRSAVNSALKKAGKRSLGEDGFVIRVTPKQILLAAEALSGFSYGVAALERHVGTLGPHGIRAESVLIVDWPVMKRRGMHTLMRGKADLPAVTEMITKLLPERRLNELILEINYHFEFKSHPEVTESGALSIKDCRSLAALAKKHHIRLIPMINCLGHQSWAKQTFKLLTTHPEFDETPNLPKDNPGIYCRSWCPSHPTVHDFVADLCDEVIDAFKADAFNIGMDEVFILGECERCKGKPNAELFAKSVNALHRRLSKKKVEVQMWGDRLLDSRATKYSKWEASDNGTAPAIDLIPKDIVICDWHYGVLQDYPSVKIFIERGFRVWPAGWDSAENARNLATTGLRAKNERMIGYLATTWLGAETTMRALRGDPEALKTPTAGGTKGAPGVRAAIIEGSRLAWEGAER